MRQPLNILLWAVTHCLGAALLATIMLAAISAHIFILHVPPTAPAVLVLLSGFAVWGEYSGGLRDRPSPPSSEVRLSPRQ
jgi:hypothetical protein